MHGRERLILLGMGHDAAAADLRYIGVTVDDVDAAIVHIQHVAAVTGQARFHRVDGYGMAVAMAFR